MNAEDRKHESYEAPRAEDLHSEEGTAATTSGIDTQTDTAGN